MTDDWDIPDQVSVPIESDEDGFTAPHPIRQYREKRLETEVVCDRCTLHYAIYGVFA